MQDLQEVAQEIKSAWGAIIVIAAVVAVFWRVVLRLLLAIIAIAVVVMVGSVAVVLLQGVHR